MSKAFEIDGREFQVLRRGVYKEDKSDPGTAFVELISLGDARYTLKVSERVFSAAVAELEDVRKAS